VQFAQGWFFGYPLDISELMEALRAARHMDRAAR
jgi:hypothetical protein